MPEIEIARYSPVCRIVSASSSWIAQWAGSLGPLRRRLARERFRCIFIYRCGEILFNQFNDPLRGSADRRQ